MSCLNKDSARSGEIFRRSAVLRPRNMTSRSRPKSRVARPVARLTAATCSLKAWRRATNSNNWPSRSVSAVRSSSRFIYKEKPLKVYRHGYHSLMSSSKKTFWTETLPEPLPANPLELAAQWLSQAQRDAAQPNPNSMILATVDSRGYPSARVVLCKEIAAQQGYIDRK